MVQQVNNSSDITQSLRLIFGNSEIYYTLETTTHNQYDISSNLNLNSATHNLKLRVKQREIDFKTLNKTWDESLFVSILGHDGVFVSREQKFNSHSSDMVLDYVFYINDIANFASSLDKFAQELYNKQFTEVLEGTLQDN